MAISFSTEYQLPRPRPPMLRLPMASTSSFLPSCLYLSSDFLSAFWSPAGVCELSGCVAAGWLAGWFAGVLCAKAGNEHRIAASKSPARPRRLDWVFMTAPGQAETPAGRGRGTPLPTDYSRVSKLDSALIYWTH